MDGEELSCDQTAQDEFRAHLNTLIGRDAPLLVTVMFWSMPCKGNPHNEFI
jgi:hypothetical protein